MIDRRDICLERGISKCKTTTTTLRFLPSFLPGWNSTPSVRALVQPPPCAVPFNLFKGPFDVNGHDWRGWIERKGWRGPLRCNLCARICLRRRERKREGGVARGGGSDARLKDEMGEDESCFPFFILLRESKVGSRRLFDGLGTPRLHNTRRSAVLAPPPSPPLPPTHTPPLSSLRRNVCNLWRHNLTLGPKKHKNHLDPL